MEEIAQERSIVILLLFMKDFHFFVVVKIHIRTVDASESFLLLIPILIFELPFDPELRPRPGTHGECYVHTRIQQRCCCSPLHLPPRPRRRSASVMPSRRDARVWARGGR